jgi:hypothetical protein
MLRRRSSSWAFHCRRSHCQCPRKAARAPGASRKSPDQRLRPLPALEVPRGAGAAWRATSLAVDRLLRPPTAPAPGAGCRRAAAAARVSKAAPRPAAESCGLLVNAAVQAWRDASCAGCQGDVVTAAASAAAAPPPAAPARRRALSASRCRLRSMDRAANRISR